MADTTTNQILLDAIFLTAQESETNRFDMIGRADLWELFYNRAAPYAGAPVAALPGLNDAERRNIQRKLIENLARRRNPVAITLGHLNLRTGPGTQYGVSQTLTPDTNMQVLEDGGDWIRVQVNRQQGFVHRDYVKLPNQPVKSRLLAVQSELLRIPLPPRPNYAIDTALLAQGTLLFALADLWNRYGGLLVVLCNELEIDPSVAVAVLMAESGGQGFAPGPDGQRMIIRFENHIFHDRWGRNNQEYFDRHFAFAPGQSWTGHKWRPDPGTPWQEFHGNQQKEWEVLAFATGLERRAARESISMGLPQIMGFNAVSVGYPQADAMFEAFASSEARQIFGFFDFVRGRGGISPLRRRDYATFAGIYNGPGQATVYAGIIQERADLFDRLMGQMVPGTRGIGGEVAALSTESGEFYPPRSASEEERVALRCQLTRLLADQRRTLWLHQALLGVGVVAILVGVLLLFGENGGAAWIGILVGLGAVIAYAATRFVPVDGAFQAKVAEIERLLDQYERLPW